MNNTKLYCVRLPRRDRHGNALYLSGVAPVDRGGPAETTGDVELAAKRSTHADAQLLAERFGGEVVEVGG